MLEPGRWKRCTSACRSSALTTVPSMRHIDRPCALMPACMDGAGMWEGWEEEGTG